MKDFAIAEMWRAERTLSSARTLVQCDPDSAASRAYYAAFHAITALFAWRNRKFRSHRGTAISNGTIGDGCRVCGEADILTLLNAARSSNLFDIDGDGRQDALTDGVLILRKLSGLTGANLISGAVGEQCTRCDASTIESYLSEAMP